MTTLTQKILQEILYYDPETGIWEWRKSVSNRVRVGELAGHWHEYKNNRYLRIGINGKHHLASRLAFLYMNGKMPERLVDHINRDTTDNRWCNLREATRSQNNINIKKKSNNVSGFRGVYWHTASGKWAVKLSSNSQTIWGGLFDNFDDAKMKRLELEQIYHKEFTHQQYD